MSYVSDEGSSDVLSAILVNFWSYPEKSQRHPEATIKNSCELLSGICKTISISKVKIWDIILRFIITCIYTHVCVLLTH